MSNFGLMGPQYLYAAKLRAFFNEDDGVIVKNDAEKITVYVSDPIKADALTELLPSRLQFGNIVCSLEVIPGNEPIIQEEGEGKASLIAKALNGNRSVCYIKEFELATGGRVTYVVFEPWVVQFYTDDLTDVNGYETTLMEDLAYELFGGDAGLNFCTEVVR